jgi:hypothetical protein
MFSLKIAAAVLGTVIAASSIASAGDYSCPVPPPCGHYQTILVTKCVEVPFTRCVTVYDHCGRPYQVERVGVKTVEVTVKKRVFVRD